MTHYKLHVYAMVTTGRLKFQYGLEIQAKSAREAGIKIEEMHKETGFYYVIDYVK